jgi:hypothetical protein
MVGINVSRLNFAILHSTLGGKGCETKTLRCPMAPVIKSERKRHSDSIKSRPFCKRGTIQKNMDFIEEAKKNILKKLSSILQNNFFTYQNTVISILTAQTVHLRSELIRSNKMQQNARIYLLQNHSTCFGCPPHPLSGVHNTVTATSGTANSIWVTTLLQRGLIRPRWRRVVDWCDGHPKHVEWLCSK